MKTMVLVLSVFLGSQAFGTKARVNSLQGARFLTDVQYFFENPAQLMKTDNLLVFEAGPSTATSSDNVKAEGGIFKNFSNGFRGGFYLGHTDDTESIVRGQYSTTLLVPENPVYAFVGRGDWGASLGFSRSDKGTTDAKQEFLQASFGVDKGVYELWGNLDLSQSARTGTTDYKGAPGLNLGGEYQFKDGYYVTGNLFYKKTDSSTGGVSSDGNIKGASVTFLDRTIKGEQYLIYYGPGLNYANWDFKGPDLSTLTLPLYIGIQYQMKDWLVLRSSISQNLILGSTKDERATAPGNKRDTVANNTKVTVGAGASWKQLTLDATFAGSTNGQVDGGNLLANAGLTFSF